MLLPLFFTLFFITVSVPVLALPLRRQGESLPAVGDEAATEPADYETTLLALRDLELDHQSGLVVDDDYAGLREQLLAQAASALERSEQEKDETVAARIEAAVRARRQPAQQGRAATVRFCPQCGRPVDAGDRFCTDCGASLR